MPCRPPIVDEVTRSLWNAALLVLSLSLSGPAFAVRQSLVVPTISTPPTQPPSRCSSPPERCRVRAHATGTVNAAVNPPAKLPVIAASWASAPSRKTLSEANDVSAMFSTLDS